MTLCGLLARLAARVATVTCGQWLNAQLDDRCATWSTCWSSQSRISRLSGVSAPLANRRRARHRIVARLVLCFWSQMGTERGIATAATDHIGMSELVTVPFTDEAGRSKLEEMRAERRSLLEGDRCPLVRNGDALMIQTFAGGRINAKFAAILEHSGARRRLRRLRSGPQ